MMPLAVDPEFTGKTFSFVMRKINRSQDAIQNKKRGFKTRWMT
jgi:hypothetical protein